MACVRVLADKTAAELTADNPRLTRGQMIVETDTGLAKVNFHSQAPASWNSLDYWSPGSAVEPSAFVDDPTGAATDTDDEARAAIIAIRDVLIAQGLMAEEEE